MSRWFRFYSDAIRNPKVAALSDADYRMWTELLATAADNDGLIPSLEALKSLLRRRSDHLKAALERLIKAGLIDPFEDGYEPHNWRKFQYKSDSSTDRVKRFRNGKGNVSVTPPETETDTETEYTPLPPTKKRGGDYGFSGQIARLNRQDYDRLRRQFHAIPDFDAALGSFDGWLAGQTDAKQRNWFGSLAPWLERRHQENVGRTRSEPVIGI